VDLCNRAPCYPKRRFPSTNSHSTQSSVYGTPATTTLEWSPLHHLHPQPLPHRRRIFLQRLDRGRHPSPVNRAMALCVVAARRATSACVSRCPCPRGDRRLHDREGGVRPSDRHIPDRVRKLIDGHRDPALPNGKHRRISRPRASGRGLGGSIAPLACGRRAWSCAGRWSGGRRPLSAGKCGQARSQPT
jgi:hypothetical protein